MYPRFAFDTNSRIQTMQASPNNPTAFADAAEMWNKRFSDDGYLFGTEPNVWLREHSSQWKAGQRVLCVADGETTPLRLPMPQKCGISGSRTTATCSAPRTAYSTF